MRAALSSEWLKLRSVTSTFHAIGAAALMVALGVVWTFYVGGLADARGAIRVAAPEQAFLPLVQMSLAVIGVLTITSEHTTGMIRASLTAVPRRGALLLAKVGMVGAATFVAAHAVILTTYVVSRLIAGDRQLGFNEVTFSHDLPMLLASGLSVTVLALVGLGLGFVTRSTAGAIVSVVSLLFVLPAAATYLPPSWNTRVAVFIGNLRGDPRLQAGRNRTPAEQGRGRRFAARRTAVKPPHDTARFGSAFDGGDDQAIGRTIGNTLAAELAERRNACGAGVRPQRESSRAGDRRRSRKPNRRRLESRFFRAGRMSSCPTWCNRSPTSSCRDGSAVSS
ncbi:ABC transporter permease [Nonomuraea cavernae]|uniref:ABC transporter permease n=1 Tax=Nonomuraea cavernae TaxID=2045107 RepID=UPI0033D8FEAC